MTKSLITRMYNNMCRWQCSSCSIVHEYEMAPASCYTMGAYISADQTPLSQCLVDLQVMTSFSTDGTCIIS